MYHVTEKEKKPVILDVCCSGRAFWFDKKNPDVLFCDYRIMCPEIVGHRKIECLPDVVMDFRKLAIPDCTFGLVVFDPPHCFFGESSHMAKRYGRLDHRTWRDDISKGFSECFRVLKIGGILIFKWSEYHISLVEILKCANEKPLFGNRSGKFHKTHWVCFMKRNGGYIP